MFKNPRTRQISEGYRAYEEYNPPPAVLFEIKDHKHKQEQV